MTGDPYMEKNKGWRLPFSSQSSHLYCLFLHNNSFNGGKPNSSKFMSFTTSYFDWYKLKTFGWFKSSCDKPAGNFFNEEPNPKIGDRY